MSAKLKIFPAPRRASVRKTRVDLDGADWIVIPRDCGHGLLDRIRETAAAVGKLINRPVHISAAPPESGSVLLDISIDARRCPSQGFELNITKGERALVGGDEAGIYYGCLAFEQIVEQFGSTPPSLTISDSPDIPARGVMLDVSRCKVPTMATLKQLVDRLAGMRINQVQLYMEHTFAFSAHRTVWHDASPFTHEDILELDRYCADRFVELVPNLNSFGHFGRWLRQPEYRHLAECPDNPATDCLAPNADSVRFLDGLYSEFLPQFSSKLFNVGCDETWELGKGRSKARAKKTSTTRVYLEFLKKIHKLVTKNGRRMQFWGDIILHQPGLIGELPRDIVALSWGYEDNTPFNKECPAFAESGIEFYVCPGTNAWNSITGRTDNCLTNQENAASNGSKHGATGCLNTDWGDGGHHQVLPISYVGFAAGAAYSWCLRANRDVDLAGAISRHFFEDPTGVLGQFCLDLGRTLNRIPGLARRNSSVIGQLLFSRLDMLDLSKVTKSQYDRAEDWLRKVEARLVDARPACSDVDLVGRELRHAVAMSLYAINRGRFAQYRQGSAGRLRKELQNLIMSHEDQWLARNRRGGLRESSTRLRKTAELFEKK